MVSQSKWKSYPIFLNYFVNVFNGIYSLSMQSLSELRKVLLVDDGIDNELDS